jgi:hypothetical protein
MLVLLEDSDGVTAREPRWWEQLASHLRAAALEKELAKGVAPETTAQLALRAQALVRVSARRQLAQTIQRMVLESLSSSPTRRASAAIPVRRDNVRDATAELQELIEHLVAPAPLPARGVAQVRMLLRDGSGPLYSAASPHALRARVRQALEALEPLAGF